MSIINSPAIFTVSRLNQSVRLLLEQKMGTVWLQGEISNFTQPASGHWYFTLKDDTAQVKCAMFRNANRRVTFHPQHGQQVVVRASITLYEPRGDYQIIIESMQPDGVGLLQQQYEQLKARLNQEGLFSQEYKKSLPTPAKCIGVITSKTGAALHDILHVLKRRDPALPVIIYPTSVQGAEAPLQIVSAIECANRRQECDVLIVGRGGGSLEDLWYFNDERVARAIFASAIPIVSAVGHETDVTIADFAADLRAPTPSAAAEIVSRNQVELLRQVQSLRQRLDLAMDYYFAQRIKQLSLLQHRLAQQDPQLRITRQQNALERFNARLINAMENTIRLKDQKLQRSFSRLTQQHPQLRLTKQQHQLERLNARLKVAVDHLVQNKAKQQQKLLSRVLQQHPQSDIHLMRSQIKRFEYQLFQSINNTLNQSAQRYGNTVARLDGVSPLATLTRGYSVTTTPNGSVVKKIEQVSTGDVIITRLNDGWVESQVTSIMPLKTSH